MKHILHTKYPFKVWVRYNRIFVMFYVCTGKDAAYLKVADLKILLFYEALLG